MDTNELEKRKLEILAVAYGLKPSELKNAEVKENYAILFSAYRKMIMDDNEHFFVDVNRKNEICSSLDASIRALGTNEKGMSEEFSQLKKNDRTSFLIFGQPILLFANQSKEVFSHCVGLLIYKNENDDYVLYLIDKNQSYKPFSTVNKLIINKKYKKKLVKLLEENKIVIYKTSKNKNFLKRLYELGKKEITSLQITMSDQVVGNCYINEVEAAFKVSLYHCRNNIDLLDTKVTPKWNDSPDATLKMREKFKDALKENVSEIFGEKCDKLFLIYKERKKAMEEAVRNHGRKDVKYNEIGDTIREKAQKDTREILTEKKSLECLKNNISEGMINVAKTKNNEQNSKEDLSKCAVFV